MFSPCVLVFSWFSLHFNLTLGMSVNGCLSLYVAQLYDGPVQCVPYPRLMTNGIGSNTPAARQKKKKKKVKAVEDG